MKKPLYYILGFSLWTILAYSYIHKADAYEIDVPQYADLTKARLSDVDVLTSNIYFESRGESDISNLMVLASVFYRVEDRRFPNTIHEVVFSPKAYSWTGDGSPDYIYNEKRYKELYKLVETFIINKEMFMEVTGKVDHYHTKDVSPYWSDSEKLVFVGSVDSHKFYYWRR